MTPAHTAHSASRFCIGVGSDPSRGARLSATTMAATPNAKRPTAAHVVRVIVKVARVSVAFRLNRTSAYSAMMSIAA